MEELQDLNQERAGGRSIQLRILTREEEAKFEGRAAQEAFMNAASREEILAHPGFAEMDAAKQKTLLTGAFPSLVDINSRIVTKREQLQLVGNVAWGRKSMQGSVFGHPFTHDFSLNKACDFLKDFLDIKVRKGASKIRVNQAVIKTYQPEAPKEGKDPDKSLRLIFRQLDKTQARLILTEFSKLHDLAHQSRPELLDNTNVLGFVLNRLKELPGLGLGMSALNNRWCEFNKFEDNMITMHGLEDILWMCNDISTVPCWENTRLFPREQEGFQARADANGLFFNGSGDSTWGLTEAEQSGLTLEDQMLRLLGNEM
jgi:hypothetical protein